MLTRPNHIQLTAPAIAGLCPLDWAETASFRKGGLGYSAMPALDRPHKFPS